MVTCAIFMVLWDKVVGHFDNVGNAELQNVFKVFSLFIIIRYKLLFSLAGWWCTGWFCCLKAI